MKINFDSWNSNINSETTTTTANTNSTSQSAKSNAYKVDFFGMHTEGNAYGEHGSSFQEIMQSMELQLDNFSAQRDLMTVLSNVMSTEDFTKMQEEGFDPAKLEPEQVVTIVDHIKAEIAKSGKVVAGYNDDLKEEELTEILGSSSLAKAVSEALAASDLPVNEENVSAIKNTLDKAAQVSALDDAGKKYMLENHLKTSVENIYRASFSAHGDGNWQAKGYFSQELPGYFAKKADIVNFKEMEPQLEKAIEKMNLNGTEKEKAMEQAKWLISKGIPVTEQSMLQLEELTALTFPMDETMVITAAIRSLTMGSAPAEGSLFFGKETVYENAQQIAEETAAISKEAVLETISADKELNLKNLSAAQKELDNGRDNEKHRLQLASMVENDAQLSYRYVHAARTLAEVQLHMSADVNIRLLKSGIRIDTMPLTELIEALKQQEEELSVSFFGDEKTEQMESKSAVFTNTRNILKELPYMPAAVIGKITAISNATLVTVHTQGAALKAQYQAAGVSYEALMTAPRTDLGDSIKKAFSNVDQILEDMGQELSEDNRKAVRILGYNQTPITEKALEEVKAASLQVENVIKSMTPQKTLEMIREGVNPLTMSLVELEEYLDQMEQSPEEEIKKYSRFLYEMEKNGQLNDGEREAYIGVYRLFHQIEKSDGAVIGSLLEQGAELTLGNLLSAVRTRKAGKLEYTIDDDFGSLKELQPKGKSISAQIENGITQARMAHAVYRDLTFAQLQQLSVTEQTTLSELRDGLIQESSTQEITWQKEAAQAARQSFIDAAGAEKAAAELLQNHGISLSAENILTAKELVTGKGSLVKKAREYAEQLDGNTESEGRTLTQMLEGAAENISTSLTDFESAQKAMEAWENGVQTVLEGSLDELTASTVDIKSLALCFKQVSMMRALRKQENYQIPMEVNGELTNVNLVLIRDSQEKGCVSVTMETESYGKVGVKFSISDHVIDSYFVAENEVGKQRLQSAGEALFETLQQKGMDIGNTHYVNSGSQGRNELNFLTFSGANVDNTNKAVATAQLYDVAKCFLSSMKDAFS